MLDYITENIEKYENEAKMLQFLSDLGLPGSLDSMISGSNLIADLTNIISLIDNISDNMWNRISAIQMKGGSQNIINTISTVEKSGDDINKRIADLEVMLQVL